MDLVFDKGGNEDKAKIPRETSENIQSQCWRKADGGMGSSSLEWSLVTESSGTCAHSTGSSKRWCAIWRRKLVVIFLITECGSGSKSTRNLANLLHNQRLWGALPTSEQCLPAST